MLSSLSLLLFRGKYVSTLSLKYNKRIISSSSPSSSFYLKQLHWQCNNNHIHIKDLRLFSTYNNDNDENSNNKENISIKKKLKLSILNNDKNNDNIANDIDYDNNKKDDNNNNLKPIEFIPTEFSKLGLLENVVRALSAQQFIEPTAVQRAVIPRLLNGENLCMAASTGSGKTLAFTVPVLQNLQIQEQQSDYLRRPKRPRVLILVPTRELARQILAVVKGMSHYNKVSSCAVLGGEQYSIQKKGLDRLVDIVVASPGRLIQHKQQGNVYLSQVSHIIIDEVDTMLTQGFGGDIRSVLRAVLRKDINKENPSDTEDEKSPDKKVQIIMATATLTKAVRTLLSDVSSGASAFNIEFSDPDNITPRKESDDDTRIPINIVEVDGVHRSLPHIRHEVEETKGSDKVIMLQSIISRYSSRNFKTLVFCNTVDSCRAVDYAINEAGIEATTYHGDLNSREREANLQTFREGKYQYMVCTDIAARGLDIPDIDHVIMFDFPLNPIDYIHRGGRCGRAGRKGLVTSLVAKRDKILSDAILGAIARGLPIDSLTAAKKDYQDRGKLAKVVGRVSKEDAPKKKKTFLPEKVGSSSSSSGGRSQQQGKQTSSSSTTSKSGVGYKKGSANRGTVVKGLGSR